MKSHTKKSHLLHWIVTINGIRYKKINSVNSLYLAINKINGNIEESEGNKYLILVSTDTSKETKISRIME